MRLSIPGMSRLIRWPADRRVLPMRILPSVTPAADPRWPFELSPETGEPLLERRNILGARAGAGRLLVAPRRQPASAQRPFRIRRVEIGALQISAGKVGIGQVRADKARAPDVGGVARGREIGVRQIGPIEDGALQVRAREVGAYEILPCEIVVLQVLARKIHPRARRRR